MTFNHNFKSQIGSEIIQADIGQPLSSQPLIFFVCAAALVVPFFVILACLFLRLPKFLPRSIWLNVESMLSAPCHMRYTRFQFHWGDGWSICDFRRLPSLTAHKLTYTRALWIFRCLSLPLCMYLHVSGSLQMMHSFRNSQKLDFICKFFLVVSLFHYGICSFLRNDKCVSSQSHSM